MIGGEMDQHRDHKAAVEQLSILTKLMSGSVGIRTSTHRSIILSILLITKNSIEKHIISYEVRERAIVYSIQHLHNDVSRVRRLSRVRVNLSLAQSKRVSNALT